MFRSLFVMLLLAGTSVAQMPPGQNPGQGPMQGQGQGPGDNGQNRAFGRPDNGPPPPFAALKPVPHGEVRVLWYDSKTLGVQRRMYIYTPPGYERGTERYPVLYLIHGRGEDEASWFTQGRAGFILDNLIAAGKAKPMILVMPNGATDPTPDQPSEDNSPAALAARATYARNDRQAFLKDLASDIVPYVDSHFRTLADRNDRAITGLSFGGAESLWAGTSESNLFAWIGTFSMGIQGGSTARPNAIAGSGSDGTPAEFVQANASFFADSDKTNRMTRLFWIGVGKNDAVVGSGPRQLSDTLTSHGIHNVYHESDGGHDMTNWRAYLNEFAPLLFR